MAFCTQCGAQVPDGTAFCSNCGAKMNPAPQNQPAYQDQGFGGQGSFGSQNDAFGGQSFGGQNDAFGGQGFGGQNDAFGGQGFGGQNDAFGGQNFGGQNFGGQNFGGQGLYNGGNGQQGGKKKSKTGLIIGIVVLVLALVGGGLFFLLGGKGSDDPNLGRYNAVSCESMGFQLDCEDEWIELKAGGKASIHILNDDFTGKWQLVSSDRIVITQNGDNFSGTLKNGVLTVDFSGIEYTFVKEGMSAPAATVAPAETAPAETEAPATEAPATEAPVQTANPYEYWAGDWYGWWIVYRGTGRYEESKGNYWDCCARITVNGSSGYIKMWDEDCPDGKTIFYSDVSFVAGCSDVGAMVSTSGAFLDQNLTYGMLSADPADRNYIDGIDNMICIHGTYTDPSNTSDTIDYLVFLRPWGTRWEDVRNRDNSQEIYSDMMPAYYDSWYLPLINKGTTSAPTYMGLDD